MDASHCPVDNGSERDQGTTQTSLAHEVSKL